MREKSRSGGGGRNGFFPNSLRIISSCLKTVSSNAGSVASSVRSAEASIAASIAVPADEEIKDQVLWAGFDKLELSPSTFKRILLLGYSNGFQVLDVEDASDVLELVSKRGGPVTYLQMQPIPSKSEGSEGFRSLHPMLLVVAGNESNGYGAVQGGQLSAFIKDGCCETQQGTLVPTPTVVRFFSLKSNSVVHVLRFHSAVYIVRCNPQIVVVALAAQVYCFDAVTLENKFNVITYPIQGPNVTNVGHGPMALGSRWLAYASNNPISSNTGRLSPQNLTPSPGVSPSTSPSNGNLVARYAMESSKQLAVGIISLGDKGYKTLSKYCQDLLPDGSNSPISSSSGRKLGKNSFSAHHSEADNAGMVVVKDFLSKDVISQFRAHNSPVSALCFDPTGTLLVTASTNGNNINVFRIMPNFTSNGSNSTRHDSTSSHAHLYKLYRGLTTAINCNAPVKSSMPTTNVHVDEHLKCINDGEKISKDVCISSSQSNAAEVHCNPSLNDTPSEFMTNTDRIAIFHQKSDLPLVCTINGKQLVSPQRRNDEVTGQCFLQRTADSLPDVQCSFFGDREKLKQTDEYKVAVKEEWASRQEQLRIQSDEVQKMRKRKKAQALLLLNMEKRQKERLDEVRESHKKEMEVINLKDKFRAEVRKQLERIELNHRSMPSLLRSLGIPVEGGVLPSSQEVNAAYKKALLRFHPDRSSGADLRQQVEAEEKFKLISRLKDKLLPR